MALGARGEKFGVVLYNLLKTLGYGDTSTPGDKECRVVIEAGDFVLKINDAGTWKTVEKTRSQERTYHGQAVIDENNPIYIPFNVFAAATSVKLKLWGVNFPSYHYTELPAHNHGGQAFASSVHTHSVSGTTGTVSADHTHTVSGTSGAEAAHTHSQAAHGHGFVVSVWTGAESANHAHNYFRSYDDVASTGTQDANHQHPVNYGGNTDSQTPAIAADSSHAHSFSTTSSGISTNHAHSFSATTGTPSATTAIPSQGISGYTLNDTAKVQIDTLIQLFITAVQGTWGTAKDINTTTPVNFSSLANINANGGTNEIDIFAHITAGSFNYIKISEPTAKKGGTILWHLSVS